MGVYLVLDIAAIWPYNASNAAVPLAAVLLGHLPQTASDQVLVKALGFTVFVLAFVPLIFGGTVYRMLEKIMTAKLVLVLGYLSIIAVAMVSWPVIKDVAAGFVRIRHASPSSPVDRHRPSVFARVRRWAKPSPCAGNLGNRRPANWRRHRHGRNEAGFATTFVQPDAIPPAIKQESDQLLAQARELSRPGCLLRPHQ